VSEPGTAQLVTIVEDDPAIAEGLSLNLKLQGYRTAVAGDGEAAVSLIEVERPDLVLLDISLPKRSGIWVLETLRDGGNNVPVIVLSARQDEFDKVAALRLGADDYVTKPFALAELLARVAAVLRRSQLSPRPAAEAPPSVGPPAVRFGDVTIDLSARTVQRAGELVKLTHLEFELLSFFCHNEQRVFSREELLREVWGVRQSTPARTVDNFVAQLRAKLEVDPDRPVHLLTVRGSGYRFVRGS
jgi:DNA-binding response OmpR family regulator